jgi:hypothetical protein
MMQGVESVRVIKRFSFFWHGSDDAWVGFYGTANADVIAQSRF